MCDFQVNKTGSTSAFFVIRFIRKLPHTKMHKFTTAQLHNLTTYSTTTFSLATVCPL
jgi:hypothetical protein